MRPAHSWVLSSREAFLQVSSAIESGVAQAAALASSISADKLENKLQERKQSALPASLVASPSDSAGLLNHSRKVEAELSRCP